MTVDRIVKFELRLLVRWFIAWCFNRKFRDIEISFSDKDLG